MRTMTGKNRLMAAIKYFASIIMLLVITVPLYLSVMGGFKSVGQLRAEPLALPSPFKWSQYGDMLTGKVGLYWLELANSVIVGLGTVAFAFAIGPIVQVCLRLSGHGERRDLALSDPDLEAELEAPGTVGE